MARSRSMIWELLRTSSRAPRDSGRSWYSSLGKHVFSCRLATDYCPTDSPSLQRKFLKPTGYTMYDLKDNHDPWHRYICWSIHTSISWKAKLFFQFNFSLWPSIIPKGFVCSGNLCRTGVLFFSWGKKTMYSCQHNLKEFLYMSSLFQSL